jgi:ribonuclease HI
MKQLMKMIDDVPDEHRKTNFCTCQSCKKASVFGCTHPNKCLETAKMLLNTLAPKWRPKSRQEHEERMAYVPPMAAGVHNGGVKVNTTREATDLGRSIRIFTVKENLVDATALQTITDEEKPDTELVVYTDGSCINNSTDEAKAGCGVWYGPLDP